MKKILWSFLLILLCTVAHSQFVAKVQMKENIDGICDNNNVYTLFPSFGDQVEAVCPVTDSVMEQNLNQIEFLKDKPNYKDKGMVGIFINCKGEMVQCKMDNNTKSSLLDEQIVNYLKTLTSWKAGKLNGKEVDSLQLISFEIKKGKLILN